MASYHHRDVVAAAGDRVDQRRPARGAVKDRRRDGERPEARVTAHSRPERGLRWPRGPERRLEERLLPAIARPVAARRDPAPAQGAGGRARFVQRRCDRTRVGATTPPVGPRPERAPGDARNLAEHPGTTRVRPVERLEEDEARAFAPRLTGRARLYEELRQERIDLVDAAGEHRLHAPGADRGGGAGDCELAREDRKSVV